MSNARLVEAVAGVHPGASAPSVLSVSPGNCTPNLSVWTNVSVHFSGPMEPNSTTAAFSIAPSVGGATTGVVGAYLNWTTSRPLPYATTFVVSVGPGAKSQAGIALTSPWISSFSTEVASTGAVPTLSSECPLDGSTNVPLDAGVQVAFDLVMSPSSLLASFSISPSVSGGTPAAGGCCLTFLHTYPFDPETTYTVRISTNATSFAGTHLAQAFNFTFTTGALPPSPMPPPGNTGPGGLPLVEGLTLLGGGIGVVVATSLVTYLLIRRSRQAHERGSGASSSSSTEEEPEVAGDSAAPLPEGPPAREGDLESDGKEAGRRAK